MKYRILLLVALITISFSCKKFVDVGAPQNSLVPETVFKNDALATSALLGIYQQMSLTGPSSGDFVSISTFCALTGDEFIGYNDFQPYYENQLLPNDYTVTLWNQLYKQVYDANTILEGLKGGTGVTQAVKTQLNGEALFIRAFSYFYLTNLYGPVPLYLSTDYNLNSTSTRASSDVVYKQIVQDLTNAELMLGNNYVTTERVRPNKSAVEALLARVYLYLGDWINAEKYSSLVIGNTGMYNLVDYDKIFLKNSQEAIWQLMPPANSNTPAGNFLILSAAPSFVSLRSDLVENAFEANDLRKTSWVKSFVSSGITYYYPFKYKVQFSTSVSEYTMVLRLAEQFLIRAEARARLNNLSGAIDDLDAIRDRADLSLIKDTNPEINQVDLINAIQKERFPELFSEWGDRWFDLKRTGKLTSVLSESKPGWKSTDALFPIPSSEISANTNIKQNDGY